MLSIMFGAKDISLETIKEAFIHFDASNPDHQILMHSRLPRTIGTCLIGAFLAISGALMQGMTRNYLASPSIMGVSDGSVFFITLAMVFFPGINTVELIFFSLAGSAFGVGVVFGLGSILPHGLSPVRLAILGTIVGTFLSSLASAFAIYFKTSQNISFWYNARLHQLDPSMIKLIIPFALAGLSLAIYLSKSITVLSLGDQVAIGLGEKVTRIKWLTILTVAILTGISVAMAGKVAFVGLLVPHMTRYLIGNDYRWIIPSAGLLGGIFLLSADLVSRFLNSPFETPISVVTSFIGVPFFIYLIKRNGGKAHV
ncbi:iron ABC transporter permease [Virgibacillus halophilus]|uniref:Iron ABC transporter permease n=2 Tax=Tigheibacillus halophilus TaxID=361280 RepID=A0ABU5C7R1_9BACI|nr:iron ABC transporter permease [Virgibacillus halophilus]